MRTTLAGAGFGEHRTPLVERDALFVAAGSPPLDHAYRFLGDAGEVLVLRPDLTIPAARSVAARIGERKEYRVFYSGTVFATGADGHPTETLKIGADVYGLSGVDCAVAALNTVAEVLADVGLDHARIGLGDATGMERMLVAAGVPRTLHERILDAVREHSSVTLREVVARLKLDPRIEQILTSVPEIRGEAHDVLAGLEGLPRIAARKLEAVLERLGDPVARRILLDLGDVPGRPMDGDGVTLNVYADGVGGALGAGGDFSSAVAELGVGLHAFGFTFDVQRLHEALIKSVSSVVR